MKHGSAAHRKGRTRDAACMVTFFGDAADRLRDAGRAELLEQNRREDG